MAATQELCPDPACTRPAGHPDAALTCDILLTAEQAAARTRPPMRPGDWRSRVNRGHAPAPDVPDTLGTANRSTPRWWGSTVDRWNLVRRPPGRPRADERGYFTVIELVDPSWPPVQTSKPWGVVDRRTGAVVARRVHLDSAWREAARRSELAATEGKVS